MCFVLLGACTHYIVSALCLGGTKVGREVCLCNVCTIPQFDGCPSDLLFLVYFVVLLYESYIWFQP